MCALHLVVLDMAGTTVEDAGQVPEAFVAALARHGIAASTETIRGVRGASKRQAILDLLAARPDRAVVAGRVFQSFRDELAARYRASVRPVDGAEETIRTLRARGVKVALNTGFDRDTTQMLLDALGWMDGVVDAVACGDDVREGRPAPDLIFRCMETTGVGDVTRVANVGDTVLDLRAAHRAGVRYNIGVLSGAHSRPALEAEPHSHLIWSVADLPGLLQ